MRSRAREIVRSRVPFFPRSLVRRPPNSQYSLFFFGLGAKLVVISALSSICSLMSPSTGAGARAAPLEEPPSAAAAAAPSVALSQHKSQTQPTTTPAAQVTESRIVPIVPSTMESAKETAKSAPNPRQAFVAALGIFAASIFPFVPYFFRDEVGGQYLSSLAGFDSIRDQTPSQLQRHPPPKVTLFSKPTLTHNHKFFVSKNCHH